MWRIKTFEEFGNKRPSEWNYKGKMDYLYGTEIPKEMWKRCELGNSLSIKKKDNRDYYCWIINSSHYVFDKPIQRTKLRNFLKNKFGFTI